MTQLARKENDIPSFTRERPAQSIKQDRFAVFTFLVKYEIIFFGRILELPNIYAPLSTSRGNVRISFHFFFQFATHYHEATFDIQMRKNAVSRHIFSLFFTSLS